MNRILIVAFVAFVAVVAVVAGDYVDDENDAVVIEAHYGPPLAPQNVRGNRQFWLAAPPQPQPFIGPNPFVKGIVDPIDAQDLTVRAPLNQACVTKNGLYGRCTTLNECYPERKIFRIPAEDTWVMGLLNTCSINTRKGRQVFGICCVRGVTQPAGAANATEADTETRDSAAEKPNKDKDEEADLRATCQLEDSDKQLVQSSQCRISKRENFLKIVNGYIPEPHQFKFMAALLSTRHGEPRQFCGGSLIDACHVLTAAHCIDGYSRYDVANLVVYLGAHNIKTPEGVRTSHKVVRLIKHKGFDQGTLYNDVAILTLANCANTQSNVAKPICLPSGDNSFVNEKVIVAGWGALSSGGSQPSELRAVEVEVWDNARCSSSYGNQAPGGIIDSMICAALPNKDSCSGDSGGPLFYCNSPDQCMQVGIVSWGIGCAHPNYPGVYTRVTKMMDWIQRIQSCY